jgi:hypothetical protein
MSTTKPTLKADWFNGEGKIGNLKEWREQHNCVLRADLLQDWIYDLQMEYEATLTECFSKKKKAAK